MDSVRVRIKRLGNGAGVPLPAKMSALASGLDVCAAVDLSITLEPGDIQRVPCGFSMALPAGYEAQVRPRSGLASRYGVTVVNSPGTIDADYRGEVQVPLINLGRAAFVVERGMRIAQMVIARTPDVEIVEVEELEGTPRGAGGFGHTGR